MIGNEENGSEENGSEENEKKRVFGFKCGSKKRLKNRHGLRRGYSKNKGLRNNGGKQSKADRRKVMLGILVSVLNVLKW